MAQLDRFSRSPLSIAASMNSGAVAKLSPVLAAAIECLRILFRGRYGSLRSVTA